MPSTRIDIMVPETSTFFSSASNDSFWYCITVFFRKKKKLVKIVENCQVFAITAIWLLGCTYTHKSTPNKLNGDQRTTSILKWECDVIFSLLFSVCKSFVIAVNIQSNYKWQILEKEPQINRRFFLFALEEMAWKIARKHTNNGIKANAEKLKFLFIFFFYSVSFCFFFVRFFYESH